MKPRRLARIYPSGNLISTGQCQTLPGDMNTNQRRIVNLWHPERVRLSPQRRIK